MERFEKSIGLDKLTARFLEENSLSVHQGPFAGMSYIRHASGSAYLPKLLGTYELELRPVIEKELARFPKRIIDVGCAEGYYAVGFAKRLPDAQIIAFDIDPVARKRCGELAKANSVGDQILINSKCDHYSLQESITDSTLVICDCEGFEWDLLCPVSVPSLTNANMLVELHEQCWRNAMDEFTSRFGKTHKLTFISAEPRSPLLSPLLEQWPSDERYLVMDEMRTDGILWVWAEANASCSNIRGRGSSKDQ